MGLNQPFFNWRAEIWEPLQNETHTMASILNFGCRCGVIWLLFFLTGHTPMFDGCEVPRTNTINTLGRKRSIGLRLHILLTTPHLKSYTKATSHMRLRARDQYISKHSHWWKRWSRTKFVLHTTLEGPMEYVNARWMWSLHGFLHGIQWIVFRGHLDYIQKPPLEFRPNTKPLGDHGTPNAHNCRFILFCDAWGHTWIEVHWNCIWLRAPLHMAFTLHLRVHNHTTWFWRCLGTAFGHFLLGSPNFMVMAHGSWLVCEVALNIVFSVTHSMSSCSILIINCSCSVTDMEM